MSKNLIVAIDGPAGSGKSTSARLVAEKLNFLYIDSGAMYRAITFLALKNNVLNNNDAITSLAEETHINLNFENGVTKVSVEGEDITEQIRTTEINKYVSLVSKIENVRVALVKKQKAMSNLGRGLVMEGRDISTVVFPNADVKIFLTASIEARANRRVQEYANKGINLEIDEIQNNLSLRDELDTKRKVSPLIKPKDAHEIDTSKVTIEQQVDKILKIVRETANKKNINL